jgi:ubiquinone/menaquinone biosynthesis C-methylase UbiE
MTRNMLRTLDISADDEVVEFAPGLGVTTQIALACRPARYTAIERDAAAAEQVSRLLDGSNQKCILASAEDTGLESESASVVYGEAMLSMQTAEHKRRIIAEAARILKPGGRYGIHELCLCPDDVPEDVKTNIQKDLSKAMNVGARPLTVAEWHTVLEEEGFRVLNVDTAPFHLLEMRRLVRDEGLFNSLAFMSRILRNKAARQRVLQMRGTFRRYDEHVRATSIVAQKRD